MTNTSRRRKPASLTRKRESGLITRWPEATGTRLNSSTPQATSPPGAGKKDWQTRSGPSPNGYVNKPVSWKLRLKELRATETPADVIQDRLFELQWTARMLAYAMDYSEKHLSLVMNGKARVTGDFAVRYWRACGGNPRRLLRAQADADLRKAVENA